MTNQKPSRRIIAQIILRQVLWHYKNNQGCVMKVAPQCITSLERKKKTLSVSVKKNYLHWEFLPEPCEVCRLFAFIVFVSVLSSMYLSTCQSVCLPLCLSIYLSGIFYSIYVHVKNNLENSVCFLYHMGWRDRSQAVRFWWQVPLPTFTSYMPDV